MLSGLVGFYHEVFLSHGFTERPELLILVAAMLGLPAFLPGHGGSEPGDKKEKEKDKDKDKE